MFQNGSVCFRLHVGHSAGEAAEGGRDGGGGGGAAAAAATRGCCWFLTGKNKNSTWARLKHEKRRRSRPSSAKAPTKPLLRNPNPHVGPEVRFGVRFCAVFAQTAD